MLLVAPAKLAVLCVPVCDDPVMPWAHDTKAEAAAESLPDVDIWSLMVPDIVDDAKIELDETDCNRGNSDSSEDASELVV